MSDGFLDAYSMAARGDFRLLNRLNTPGAMRTEHRLLEEAGLLDPGTVLDGVNSGTI